MNSSVHARSLSPLAVRGREAALRIADPAGHPLPLYDDMAIVVVHVTAAAAVTA